MELGNFYRGYTRERLEYVLSLYRLKLSPVLPRFALNKLVACEYWRTVIASLPRPEIKGVTIQIAARVFKRPLAVGRKGAWRKKSPKRFKYRLLSGKDSK